jgi:V-type H+-transporting ATPase subunit a
MSNVKTKESPPTYHKQNKVTTGFQSLVNAYGVPSYQEINPAPFAVITFPFLFAVMFGDAGHAILMLLAALFMVKKENWLKKAVKGNEVLEIFFGGRYIILLMAVFSIYSGLIYNDFFSKSASIFESSWKVTVGKDFPFATTPKFILNPDPEGNYTKTNLRMYSGTPYPFGVDPVWQFASNKIAFTNSMKMKLSIILGVTQMIFGLILGLLNHMLVCLIH